MCGITGFANVDADELLIRRLVATLDHRGPDDNGIRQFSDPISQRQVAIGQTRLSIIDLSVAGHQPMQNEDGTIWIIFNGEIYNFQELRINLETHHHFRSHSDTEVILHLYEEVGTDVVRYLNGIFAFTIYDQRKGMLFLARDHVGIKPLYYIHKDGHFVFASEIKAILASGLFTREVNWQAIWDYFSFLYIPHPQTAFRDIYQLPPGSWLQYDIAANQVTSGTFWDPTQSESAYTASSNNISWSQQLRALLEDSVERQMISDVPLGAFLSGGIDSSIIVGLMAQHAQKPIQTFTVLFTGQGVDFYNEQETATAVAQRWQTDHHELLVDISAPDEMLNLVTAFDQPFGNPTLYLSYLISKATRQHVTVAISGAGGDELFAGYPRYKAVNYGRHAGKIPGLAPLARTILKRVPDDFTNPTIGRLKLFFDGLSPDFAQQYMHWAYYFNEEAKAQLLRSTPFCNVQSSLRQIRTYIDDKKYEPAFHNFMNLVQYMDVKTYLVDNILEYTDRTSMATALEVRVPFLDYRIVELSQAMPYHHKLRKGVDKAILRETFRDLIPPENLRTPKKGFCPPIALWMQGPLDRYFEENMTKAYLDREDIFEWDAIQRLRLEHMQGKRDNSLELFGIIMFDVWYRRYICS
ncbi:MAG: asparagine synthase (glutamine-hydrolyzing) [Caldilineaceae bacterium]